MNEQGSASDRAKTRSDAGFSKTDRLLGSGDFARVRGRKRSVADDLLVVYGCENGLDHPRLGLTVSRRAGNAVVRNRWKRLIREAFRTSGSRLPQGIDLVVSPRRPGEPSFSSIQKSLVDLAKRVERKITKRGKGL